MRNHESRTLAGVHSASYDDQQLTECFLPQTPLKAWSWDLEGEEGASQLYFETGLPVRLQVTGLTYTPPPTPVDQSAAQSRGDPIPGSADCPHAPLVVTAKADGDGLGMVHWYDEGAMEEGS